MKIVKERGREGPLNHQVVLRINKWSADELRDLSAKTSLPQSIILRAFVNTSLMQLKNVPPEDICFVFKGIKITGGKDES